MLSFGGAASRYAGFCLVTPRNLIELSTEEGGRQPTTQKRRSIFRLLMAANLTKLSSRKSSFG